MKVVGVVGSPRLGGNTELLTRMALDEVQKEGLDTELIRPAGKKIAPCDGCRNCRNTGKCHIQDNFGLIFTKMVEADGIILATPVYYDAATPQMTSLISRFYFLEQTNSFENKVGGPIVVARRAGHNFTLAQLMFFFTGMGIIVPSSLVYWNIAFGREKGDVTADEEGVQTIKDFGYKIAWLIMKIAAK
jgi:multimeric flavodoxin WrbA